LKGLADGNPRPDELSRISGGRRTNGRKHTNVGPSEDGRRIIDIKTARRINRDTNVELDLLI
jgi:hypothetical protein